MPFEADLSQRAIRCQRLRQLAYEMRIEAKMAEETLRELRITRSRVSRRLDRLWSSASRAHNNSRQARYGSDSGRARACDERYELLNLIIDEISDTLLDLSDRIAVAEDVFDDLSIRAEAAEKNANMATRRFKEFSKDRKRLVAELAGVPAVQLRAGAYEVRINSREFDKLDVYYNEPGRDPLGEGHGHIVLGFDCTVREHRPPMERAVQRVVPKPGSWLGKTPTVVPRESAPLAA